MTPAWSRVRGWLQGQVRAAWQARGPLPLLMGPLALLHWTWRGLRRVLRALGLARPQRLPVPVVVVGNLLVGGTGKTPLVIDLVAALRARGWHPGVVARGVGGGAPIPVDVEPASDPAQCGDEPLLVRCVTGAPVAVGRDRVAAARLLLSLHPSCNLIIADDGLQHRRLARDFEIAVLSRAGLGNGWLLPAGPLRDPPARLRSVDAVVLHGEVPPVRIHSPFYRMSTAIRDATCMVAPERQVALADLAREQQEHNLRLLALCAIGAPERFFAQLRAWGLRIDTLALPDHARIDATLVPQGRYDRVLVTEKDAVKCHRDPRLGRDERIWVVPLHASVDPGLAELISNRLQGASHGPEAA